MAASFCRCFRAGASASGGSAKVAPAFSGIGGPPSAPGAVFAGDEDDSDDEIAMAEYRNTVLREQQQNNFSSILDRRDDSTRTDGSSGSEESSFSDLTAFSMKVRHGASMRSTHAIARHRAVTRGDAVAPDAAATSVKRSGGSAPPETAAAVAKGRGVDEGNIGLELRRCLPTQHWGFVWPTQTVEHCSERVLEKVLRGSPADVWNTEHPGQDVQAGDVLVRVNGKGGRLDLMTAEFGKMHVFCEFRPGDARHFGGIAASSSCCTGGSTRANTEVGYVSMGSTSASCRDGPYPKAKLPTPMAVEAPSPGAANAAGFRGVYSVRLRRESPSQRWGLVWDEAAMERSELRVLSKVTPGSLAADWNATNAAQEMQVGDTLLSVNGKTGRMELLSVELRRNEIVCEFRPGCAQLGAVPLKTAAPDAATPAPRPGAPPPMQQCFPASGNRKSVLSAIPTCEALLAEAEPGALPPSADALKGASSSDNAQPSHWGRYRVEMSRPSSATRWGFLWDSDAMEKRHVRLISKVLPGTLAEKWNNDNPGQEIRAGDTLVSINGKSGRLECLTIELNKDHIVCDFQSGAVQPPDCPPSPQTMALHMSDSDAEGCANKLAMAADTSRGRAQRQRPAADSQAGRKAPAPLWLSTRNSIADGRSKGSGAAPLLLPLNPRRSQSPSSPGVEPAAVAASAAAAAANAAAVAASAAAAAAVAAAAVPIGGVMAGGDDAAQDTDIDDAPQDAAQLYVVELRRSPTEEWGFVWDSDDVHEEAHRTLSSVSPGTPAARWNAANPGVQMQPGDALVKVNGGLEKPELQTRELNSTRTTIVCEFRSARGLPAAVCPRPQQGAVPTGGVRLHASQHADSASVPKPPWWEVWPEGGGQVISAAPEAVCEAVQHIMDMGQDATAGAWCPEGRRFKVVKVLHNKHAELWQAYLAARSQLKRNGGASGSALPPLGPPARDCMGMLDSDVGECLLLHGIKPNSIELACQACFGSNGGAAPGSSTAASFVHLYEASSAADPCAQDHLEGRETGLCALMLCRAACGTSLVREDARLEDMASTLQDAAFANSFDSAVCGDPASRCREVVVCDKSLVYPEYVVLYRRALGTDSVAV